jgi:hypothetical protein
MMLLLVQDFKTPMPCFVDIWIILQIRKTSSALRLAHVPSSNTHWQVAEAPDITCKQNRVTQLCIPSHCQYKIQPLYCQYKKPPLIFLKMYSLRGWSGTRPDFQSYLCAFSESENLHNFVHDLKIKPYTHFIFTEVKYYININFLHQFAQMKCGFL